MASEQFSLCWDNFHKNMSSGMHSLLETEDLVDVTLAVEGKYLKAHKMVLSVCSPYFRELFQVNPCKHPIVFMKDVSYVALSDLLTFMYQGEVQVNQENLATFIKTAEALQIKGLTGDGVSIMTFWLKFVIIQKFNGICTVILKVVDLNMRSLIELTIFNKRVNYLQIFFRIIL